MRTGIRIYDCFTFFNELDLLEIRLNELSSVVDRFVIAEARTTFTGLPKPLYFEENRSRFAAFADRIEHVIVDDTPQNLDTWHREYHQRNALARGIADANIEDLILLSDVDELPRRDALQQVISRPPAVNEIFCFELRMFYYFVNLEGPIPWLRNGPRLVLKKSIPTMQRLRDIRGPSNSRPRDALRAVKAWSKMGRHVRRRVVRDAGWHFSYLGGIDAVADKVLAIAGNEKLSPELHDSQKISKHIGQGLGVREGDPPLRLRPLDDTFPHYLGQNLERFQHLVADPDVLDQMVNSSP